MDFIDYRKLIDGVYFSVNKRIGEMVCPSVEASTAAAELFLTNVMGRLSNTNYTLPQLRKSILPFTRFNGTDPQLPE